TERGVDRIRVERFERSRKPTATCHGIERDACALAAAAVGRTGAGCATDRDGQEAGSDGAVASEAATPARARTAVGSSSGSSQRRKRPASHLEALRVRGFVEADERVVFSDDERALDELTVAGERVEGLRFAHRGEPFAEVAVTVALAARVEELLD